MIDALLRYGALINSVKFAFPTVKDGHDGILYKKSNANRNANKNERTIVIYNNFQQQT
jgi:hypothetical protein